METFQAKNTKQSTVFAITDSTTSLYTISRHNIWMKLVICTMD